MNAIESPGTAGAPWSTSASRAAGSRLRRFILAASLAMLIGMLATGSAFAAPPTIERIDVSSPEMEASFEEHLLGECGYAIDVEAQGHIIVHVFDGNPRLLEISNFRLFETFSANGKSIVVHPDSGPDIIWVDRDGALYLALVGRSITGSGVIGRTVVNLTTGELVSVHGRELGDFFEFVCGELAP